MKITINNTPTDTAARTLADIAAEQQLPEKGVAMAVNNEMVPRDKWQERALAEGDDIVILKAFCGG